MHDWRWQSLASAFFLLIGFAIGKYPLPLPLGFWIWEATFFIAALFGEELERFERRAVIFAEAVTACGAAPGLEDVLAADSEARARAGEWLRT